MRRALTRIVIFVLVLLALDRLIYAGAIHLRDTGWQPPDIDLIYRSKWEPQIVFFGDSRTRRNFDMRVVENETGLPAYNLGRDGASTATSVFMLEQYLRQGHTPRVVIFEADVRSLDRKVGQFKEGSFRDRVAVIPTIDEMLGDARPTPQRLVSTFAATWILKSASIPNRLPTLWRWWLAGEGERTFPGDRCEVDDSSIRCLNYHGSELFRPDEHREIEPKFMATSSIDEPYVRIFEHVAALAQRNGFALILAATPRFHDDEAYPHDIKARAEAFYCSVAAAHPHVVYARMTHVAGVDRDRSLYRDWTHFNSRGAGKMSNAISPLISSLATGTRMEPCVFD